MSPELPELAWAASWLLALISAPSVVTGRAGRPTAALAWLLALFVFPGVGALTWWTLGRTHLRVKVRRRRLGERTIEQSLRMTRAQCGETPAASPLLRELICLPETLRPWVFRPSSGNELELLPSGRDAYEAWERAIRGARTHISLLFYIWKDDRIGTRMRDALIQAAQRGVTVRMLLDGVGTSTRSAFFRSLVAAGVDVRWFLPPWNPRHALALNFRNHRKLLVVDGEEGFVGGLNVGDEYEQWVDCATRLRGPSVDQLQEVFCDDWYFATGEDIVDDTPFGLWADRARPAQGASVVTVAGGPHQQLNAIREVTLSVLSAAEQRVWLMTPYFIPDSALASILRVLRYRGVDVRILLPSRSDVFAARRASRAYYPELVDAGVRIFEYEGMLHAKAAVIDQRLGLIGSANLDQRSFRLNFEVATLIDDTVFNDALSRLWARCASASSEVRREDFANLSWPTRVVDATFHLASPLL